MRLVGAMLVCLASPLVAQGERIDLLLHHGKVFTADDRSTIQSAVAIRDGRIVAVGGNELVGRYQATRSIDLHGRLAVPGFNDSHIHINGDPKRHLELGKVRSLVELLAKVTAKARELGSGEWVTGYGWSEDQLAERRRPLRADLDRAAPNNPVALTRAGGHSIVANSRGLALAMITRTTPDPDHGVIEHDARGEPNGVIRERNDVVLHLVPAVTNDEVRPSFLAKLEALLTLGITSIVQAGETPADFAEWETVYRAHRGALPRATVQIYWAGADTMRAFGRTTGDGDEWLRVGAVKMLVDGGFTGPAAYTLAPYKGQATYRGKLNYTPDELYRAIKTGHDMGWQFGLHTIGDGAIALTVSTFDRVLRESPRKDHRHYLNHFTILPPDSTLAMMARDSILITQQANFTYTLEGRYTANLDGERLEHNNPVRTPMRRGIFLALSSDILPIGPMVGLYAAVTRKGVSGRVFAPDERITMPEAIRAYTRNGAFITREETLKGTLEPGKLADIVVLNEDLLAIDPARILGTKVDLTILGGRVVYQRR